MAEKKNTGITVARLSVEVSPDTSNFGRDLRRKLQRLKDLTVEVEAVPDASKFREKLAAATRGKGGKVKVEVDVDRNSLSRVRDAVTGLASDASRAASTNSRIPSVPTDYGGLAAYAALAAAATLAIGPALGLISSALVSLPGLIAGVAAPVGALTLGMDGLKKAAEVLKQPFEDLKTSMSDVNMKLFTPVFETLGKVIPTLKTGLPAVSQGLAQMAQSFADTLTSEEGLGRIRNTLMNISSALLVASPGISSFTDGLLTLAEKVSSKFPSIGKWFSEIGTQFTAWVDRISADGSLDASLNELGNTIAWVVDVLGDLVAQGMDFFSDPSRVLAFRDALWGVGETLKLVANIGTAAWTGIASMLDSVTTGFIGFAGVVGTLADKLSGLPIVGDKFAGIGDALKEAAGKAIEFKGNLDASKQAAQQLRDALNNPAGGAGLLGGAGASAGLGLKPVVVPPPNVDGFKAAMNELPATMAEKSGEVQAQADQIPGKVGQSLGGLSGIGNTAGAALMQGLTAGMQSGEGPLMAYVGTLAGKIAANKGPIPYDRKVLIPNGQALMEGLGTGMETGLSPVLAQAKEMAGKIGDQFADMGVSSKQFKDIGKAGGSLIDAGADLLKAPVKYAASDLGIGGGALSAAAEGVWEYGKQMLGNQYNFHVSNVDEALSIKDREASKRALNIVGR